MQFGTLFAVPPTKSSLISELAHLKRELSMSKIFTLDRILWPFAVAIPSSFLLGFLVFCPAFAQEQEAADVTPSEAILLEAQEVTSCRIGTAGATCDCMVEDRSPVQTAAGTTVCKIRNADADERTQVALYLLTREESDKVLLYAYKLLRAREERDKRREAREFKKGDAIIRKAAEERAEFCIKSKRGCSEN
jgi:hypothetical protein